MPSIHSLHWAPPEWLSWLEISVELGTFEKLFIFFTKTDQTLLDAETHGRLALRVRFEETQFPGPQCRRRPR